ncbi:RVT_3 domain-containing protein [Cephalotus follicularis]|uniref:RVT_3 domain-containing protein n=1 Tax=Cephalotus follicularis TaxID=3775 RepID=A0A1Q3DC11_CEPFO|nr:RVT_3 domain-containing protein [Cephalotus follicularis]
MGEENVRVYSDSQLVLNQLDGSYEARELLMARYLNKVKNIVKQFRAFKIIQIPRESNLQADTLSKLATMGARSMGKPMFWEVLKRPSIEETEDVMCVKESPRCPGWTRIFAS